MENIGLTSHWRICGTKFVLAFHAINFIVGNYVKTFEVCGMYRDYEWLMVFYNINHFELVCVGKVFLVGFLILQSKTVHYHFHVLRTRIKNHVIWSSFTHKSKQYAIFDRSFCSYLMNE